MCVSVYICVYICMHMGKKVKEERRRKRRRNELSLNRKGIICTSFQGTLVPLCDFFAGGKI